MGRRAVDRDSEGSLVKLMIACRKEIIHFEHFLGDHSTHRSSYKCLLC